MPTSPTCDVTRNIDVGENARLVTGEVTRKQSTSLQQTHKLSIARNIAPSIKYYHLLLVIVSRQVAGVTAGAHSKRERERERERIRCEREFYTAI